jgi:hypothetical protein
MIQRAMDRVEKFRQARNLRQKYIFSAIVFMFLLTAGICVADYSVNGLMEGSKGLAIIAVKTNETDIEIEFMNQKLYINTQYINRDIGRLKHEVTNLFGAQD